MNNPLTPEQQTMLATWQRFLASIPSDIELIPVSEISGQDRLVEEMVVRFTHSVRTAWMLPGVPPTGRKAAFSLVVIMGFGNGKLTSEHIFWDWDQATVLAQLLGTPAAAGGVGRSGQGWCSWGQSTSVRARLCGQIRRLLDGLAAKRETRRAILELSALSDRELRDIGVTRADICRVASEGVSGFRAYLAVEPEQVNGPCFIRKKSLPKPQENTR